MASEGGSRGKHLARRGSRASSGILAAITCAIRIVSRLLCILLQNMRLNRILHAWIPRMDRAFIRVIRGKLAGGSTTQ